VCSEHCVRMESSGQFAFLTSVRSESLMIPLNHCRLWWFLLASISTSLGHMLSIALSCFPRSGHSTVGFLLRDGLRLLGGQRLRTSSVSAVAPAPPSLNQYVTAVLSNETYGDFCKLSFLWCRVYVYFLCIACLPLLLAGQVYCLPPSITIFDLDHRVPLVPNR